MLSGSRGPAAGTESRSEHVQSVPPPTQLHLRETSQARILSWLGGFPGPGTFLKGMKRDLVWEKEGPGSRPRLCCAYKPGQRTFLLFSEHECARSPASLQGPPGGGRPSRARPPPLRHARQEYTYLEEGGARLSFSPPLRPTYYARERLSLLLSSQEASLRALRAPLRSLSQASSLVYRARVLFALEGW